MDDDNQFLLTCREHIERRLNWGNSSTWSNDDFEQLSELILQKTKVRLSISTLKRIWGKVSYESKPTNSTLNALAFFIDYQNWRGFCQSAASAKLTRESAVQNSDRSGIWFRFRKNIKLIATTAIVLLFTVGIYLILHKIRLQKLNDTVRFSSRKITDDIPNSVIFSYDASAFHSDSVFIQQSWDPSRRQRVPGDGKTFTSIYYRPGYFIAKLIVDGEIKKESVVFIKSRGWNAMINKSFVPIYLTKEEIHQYNGMGVSDTLLKKKIGSEVFNETWVYLSNVREFSGIEAGNFDLETVLRNTSATNESLCATTNLVILGTGMAISIPLANKGCISDIGILTGDNWIDGKVSDLSAFGVDFSQLQKLRCSVHDHILSVSLNNKAIFRTKQVHNIGRIVGIRFEFQGAGVVKSIKLSSPGAPQYLESF